MALHELDRRWEDHGRQRGQVVRDADEVVSMSRTEAAARAGLRRVGLILARLGLALHPDTTRVVDVRDGRQGFDFLGVHQRQVESWRWRGKPSLHHGPGQRAMPRIRDRVTAITAPRYRLKDPVETLVTELHAVLHGWGASCRVGNAHRQFQPLDRSVRERLALFLSKQTGPAGRRWQDHSLACCRALGLPELHGPVAWATATPPRSSGQAATR